MVKYKLKEKDDDRLLYFYYPEGNMNRKPGVIEYDLVNHNSFIRELAADDRIIEVPVEDLNNMADIINKMAEEREMNHSCRYVSEPCRYAVYGDHAMNGIAEKIQTGNVVKSGTVMWY